MDADGIVLAIMKQRASTSSGFTLVEILLVITVMAILSAAALGSFSNSQGLQVFTSNFEQILSTVRQARSLAITAKGQPDYTDSDRDTLTADSTPVDFATPANYGIQFNTSVVPAPAQVILFADLYPPTSGIVTGSVGVFDSGTNYTQGQDIILRTLDLPKSLELKVMRNSGGTLGPVVAPLGMFFSPLYADVKFDPEPFVPGDTPILYIQLSEVGGTRCRQINIHQMAGVPEVVACL